MAQNKSDVSQDWFYEIHIRTWKITQSVFENGNFKNVYLDSEGRLFSRIKYSESKCMLTQLNLKSHLCIFKSEI